MSHLPVPLSVRINGKRINTYKLLQDKQAALLSDIRHLQKHNSALRAKEAMQFDMLRGYEDAVGKMCQLLQELLAGSESDAGAGDGSGAELSAVLLVLRSAAQELLQQVLNGGQGGWLVQGCCGRHTQLIWARVTPEAVLAMRHISAPQLAERFKQLTMRIALLRQCQGNGKRLLKESVGDAVLAYGEVVLLAMCAADRAFLEANTYDLEDMVPQGQQPDTAALLRCLQLSSEQRQQIALAYECFRSQRAAVLQQQESIICELQAVLAAGSLQAAGTHQTDASRQRSADAVAGNPAAASCPELLPAAPLAGAAAAGGAATAGTCPPCGAEAGQPVQWTGSSALTQRLALSTTAAAATAPT